MAEFDFPDPRHALYELSRVLVSHGDEVSPRGILTYELQDVLIHIDDMGACLPEGMNRKLNTCLSAVEALSIAGGFVDERLLTAAAPRYLTFVGGSVTGGYGPRISKQMPYVIEMLRNDPDTRQAQVMIWDPVTDLYRRHGDRPCTALIRFKIRNGVLVTTVDMRSNDLWLGATYDWTMFSMIHHSVANVLGVPAGRYNHFVSSLHVYDRDVKAIGALNEPPDQPVTRLTGLHGKTWKDVEARARDLTYSTDVTLRDETEAWFVTQVERTRERGVNLDVSRVKMTQA